MGAFREGSLQQSGLNHIGQIRRDGFLGLQLKAIDPVRTMNEANLVRRVSETRAFVGEGIRTTRSRFSGLLCRSLESVVVSEGETDLRRRPGRRH